MPNTRTYAEHFARTSQPSKMRKLLDASPVSSKRQKKVARAPEAIGEFMSCHLPPLDVTNLLAGLFDAFN